MDGSAQIPVDPQYPILVEVKSKLLRLENPDTHERRAAHEGDTLFGMSRLVAAEAWIIFADGFGIRERRLKEAWDDLAVEVAIYEEGGKKELFT